MKSTESPPLAPAEGFDFDVYIVLDDFGSLGRSYRETDERRADRETLIRDLMAGEFENPVRIVCFNTARGHVKRRVRGDRAGDQKPHGSDRR